MHSNTQPSAPVMSSEDNKREIYDKLDTFIITNEINIADKEILYQLIGYDIIFLIDDSGSMYKRDVKNEYGYISRWEELKSKITILLELSIIFDDDGIDLYFLNRGCVKNVKSLNELNDIFSTPPGGPTHLSNALQKIEREFISDKQKLLIVSTDGEPNDFDSTFQSRNAFKNQISKMLNMGYFIQIMACTDEDSVVEWLNSLDKSFQNFDVTDDYETISKNMTTRFSKGDYIIKALMGPINEYYNKIGEF